MKKLILILLILTSCEDNIIIEDYSPCVVLGVEYYPEDIITTIDIGSEHIFDFPECICQQKYLRYLIISNNSISELPEEIGNLKKLIHLDIMNNLLTELPKSIKKLGKSRGGSLEYLRLHNNMISDSLILVYEAYFENDTLEIIW